jgi:hypothetical protein
MQQTMANGLTRRGLLRAFAATTVVAAPTYANAFGFLRGAGDIRKISIYSSRSGETLESVYWIEGNYIPEVMTEINRIMRDWRSGDIIRFDNRTIDIMAASHPSRHERALHAPLRLPVAPDQRDAAQPVGRCRAELAPHEGPGGRSPAQEPQRLADGAGGGGLQRGRRRQVLPVELRAHGLRPRPRLGPLIRRS